MTLKELTLRAGGQITMCFMYGDEWESYICSKCGCGMPQVVNGEDVAAWFNYCPFCGEKIRAFYESKEDAESLLTTFELKEYT